MFGKDFLKHINEVRRNILNFKFEKTPFGLFFPSMGAIAQGKFTEWPGHPFSHLDRAAANSHFNLVTAQGLNYMIATGLLGGAQQTNFYVAIGSSTGPVTSSWTGANYPTNGTEYTTEGPEGYSQTVRQTWTGVANTGNSSADNGASPASVTIVTAASLNVNNAALIGSDNVKGGTSGTLIGAVVYGATRTLGNGDTYNIEYEFDLNTP